MNTRTACGTNESSLVALAHLLAAVKRSSILDLLVPDDRARLEDIDLDSICYWDETGQNWIGFPHSPRVARGNNS
jgi:hypothetical protein